MAKDLIIGSAGLKGFEESVSIYLRTKKLEINAKAWSSKPDTIATISCLNGASVMELLRHAVQLAGYSVEDEGLAAGADGKTVHRNFPWWDNSLWLPVRFDNPSGLLVDPTFFVGSCLRLIEELDDMKKISPLMLGEVGPEYALMRSDFQKFARGDIQLNLTTEDSVRWVWRALRDGAEIAIAENAPLWLGPD